MKEYTITVNGNVYNVTVEEGGAVAAAPVAAPKAAPAAAPKAAPAPKAEAASAASAAAPAADTPDYRQINMQEAITRMEEESDYILLDVRTPQEYRDGFISGSKNIPLGTIDKVDSVVENKDTVLFVYCYSGARSRQATSMLQGMGYTNVNNIGGIAAYSGKVAR